MSTDNTPEWADILTALTDRDAVLTALRIFGAEREDAIIADFRNVIEERDAARWEVEAMLAELTRWLQSPRPCPPYASKLAHHLTRLDKSVTELQKQRDALRARVAELESEPRRDDSTDFTRLMDHIRQRMQAQADNAAKFTRHGRHDLALREMHQSDALLFVIRDWRKGIGVRRLSASDTPAAVAVKAAKEAAND